MTPEQMARTFNPASQKHYDEGCRDTIDDVLEIIEAEMDEVNCIKPEYWLRLYKMRGKVLALKGGEQKV